MRFFQQFTAWRDMGVSTHARRKSSSSSEGTSDNDRRILLIKRSRHYRPTPTSGFTYGSLGKSALYPITFSIVAALRRPNSRSPSEVKCKWSGLHGKPADEMT